MGYRLSAKALQDLINIYEQGVEAFGIQHAERYQARLHKTIDLLGSRPELARERTEINPPVRIYPCSSHIIVYRIDDTGDAYLLRIRHSRENWGEHPE